MRTIHDYDSNDLDGAARLARDLDYDPFADERPTASELADDFDYDRGPAGGEEF